jgi:hypothetical protein
MSRMSAGSTTRFGTPERGKGSEARPEKGRACAEPGCMTLLSTYNTDDRCYVHVAPSFRHPLYRN